MPFLIALGVLLLLVLIILFFPVILEAGYNESPYARIRILYFIKIQLYPKKTSKNEKPQPKDKETPQKKNILEELQKYKDLLSSMLEKFVDLLSKVTLKKLILDVKMASPDPALTAIEYGAACAVIYPFLNLISSFMKFNPLKKSHKINVYTDFDTDEAALAAHSVFSVIPASVLVIAISLFLALGKNKAKPVSPTQKSAT